MNETRDLVEFLWKLEARDLPPEVFDRTRYFLLDYLGVAIRGSRAESSTPVYKMIERIERGWMRDDHWEADPHAAGVCGARERHGGARHRVG